MENTLELVTKFGLGIALALVLAYLLGLVIKWMLNEFSKKIDDLHLIIVKLIERINRLDDDVSEMARKMNFERSDLKEE
jgi:F0F1-type ATP synthase membrane subunit b/b'